MKGFKKDNTGYDIKRLMLGAEGTLGFVTEAAIACHAIPYSKKVAIFACSSFTNLHTVLNRAK
jgi:FAD/FMN-containing dehydrogenase